MELSLEVESELTLSGGGLMRLSGSAVLSLDIPGRRMLPVDEIVSDASSTWFFLNAAEPAPRSWVCLNHDGSRDPSDCAI